MASSSRPTFEREAAYPAGERIPPLTAPAAVRRISWGAIFAGIAVILVAQLLLTLLGLAIGLSTVDPTGQSPQASTLGIAGGVWWVITSAISVLLGAWVAGRLAGMPTATDGMLHGIVTWAAATLVAFYLLTSTVSSVVGSTFGALGSAVQALGQGTQSLASTAMQVLPDNIRGQAERLFDRAPDAAATAQQQADQARQAAGGGSMLDAVQRVVRGVQEGAAPQDREAAVNVIAQQAGVPRDEAERRLNEFQGTYRQYSQEAAQQARETAEQAADTVAQTSFWSVVSLLIGAVLAALGGRAGTPRDLRTPV